MGWARPIVGVIAGVGMIAGVDDDDDDKVAEVVTAVGVAEEVGVAALLVEVRRLDFGGRPLFLRGTSLDSAPDPTFSFGKGD